MGGGYFVFIFHKNPSWMSQYNVFIIFKMFTEYLKYLWSPCIYWYWILCNQSSKYTHNILKTGVTDDKHVQGSIVVWGHDLVTFQEFVFVNGICASSEEGNYGNKRMLLTHNINKAGACMCKLLHHSQHPCTATDISGGK